MVRPMPSLMVRPMHVKTFQLQTPNYCNLIMIRALINRISLISVLELCPEKVGAATANHSSSSLALAATLSIILSLSAGIAIGYFIGIRRHSTIYRLRNRDNSSLSFNCKSEKVQNQYEIDDTPRHACTEQCSALGNGKQCNLYTPRNDRKENNVLQPVNGVNHLSSLDRQKPRIVYL